jgi:hypothetical protein
MNQPRSIVELPVTTEELRRWIANVVETSPVGDGHFTVDYTELVVTNEPFMGVELTFQVNEKPIASIVFFATIYTPAEIAIEEGR